MLTSKEIRSLFLKYFEDRGHQVVSSSSLVPANDPTLLFTNAGMVQFKDLFSGKDTANYTKAASSQRCVRAGGKHNDLENVGFTPRHHTFFEMLGNFSFGDYFKKDAILYAWEFITQIIQLPTDRLFVTIFHGDDETPRDAEAFRLWKEVAGIAEERIVELGRKDNFWAMGDTGPCGPCSEIHYMKDPAYERFLKTGKIEITEETDNDFLEFWNLVFMQYERHEDGTLTELPAQSIDTGLGLERITALLQNKENNYETDIFQGLIDFIANKAGKSYGSNEEDDVCLKVIADHARTTAFLITDGVLPGNDGRNYVLRRIMRRAIRYGAKLGFQQAFFHEVCLFVVEDMKEIYPELAENRKAIQIAVQEEEKRFRATLGHGIQLLEQHMKDAKAKASKTLSGTLCFELYDTYGFPFDLTELLCREKGLEADFSGFEKAMEEQKERGRASWKKNQTADLEVYENILNQTGETLFLGYQEEQCKAKVRFLLVDGQPVEKITQGQTAEIFLDQTCAYAESGGQVGDEGLLQNSQALAFVLDVQKPFPSLFSHHIQLEKGEIAVGNELEVLVDGQRKQSIRAHHSATHLLHHALRETLGKHVKQSGSLVDPERLRFDFSHYTAITDDELKRIEQKVNELICWNYPIETKEVEMEEAQRSGAMALFGEKYGDKVRMVQMGPSIELCGGNHSKSTGQLGSFRIQSEQGVAAGVRRIEAVAGTRASEWVDSWKQTLAELTQSLHCKVDELPERIQRLQSQVKELSRTVEELNIQVAQNSGGSNILDKAQDVQGIQLLATTVAIEDAKAMRQVSDQLRDKLKSGVVVLGSSFEGKVTILASVTKDLVGKVHAGKLIQALAPIVGGKGGGKSDFAQGGGNLPEKLSQAMDSVAGFLKEQLN